MTEDTDTTTTPVEPGEEVYDDEGNLLGQVEGLTDEGFEVETVDGHPEEEVPGQEFGEGYLMWRCTECGEMGELEETDGLPESCPDCGAPKEAIAEQRED